MIKKVSQSCRSTAAQLVGKIVVAKLDDLVVTCEPSVSAVSRFEIMQVRVKYPVYIRLVGNFMSMVSTDPIADMLTRIRNAASVGKHEVRLPHSNYPPDTVSALDHRARLEYQNNQGGISTSAPPDLAAKSHSLPPILHRSFQHPMSRCSKGAQGLSV